MQRRAIRVRPTGEYPAQWDDLIGPDKRVIATIYTVEEGEKDHRKRGIKKGRDGIYEIVVDAKEINNGVVRKALADLGKRTGRRYVLASPPSLEDRMIAYAERLMKPLKKYGTSKRGYDFARAKTPKQKAEVIGIWIGEILYEALTYKDATVVKSLTETIKTELTELIRQ